MNINRLESIRHAHTVKMEECTDRMEDYLEVIYELIRQKGYATAIDISESLSISSPSVTKMLKRLDENKLLAEFLKMIGVDENIANIDAEGIEHHIHSETLKKLETFVNNVKNNNPKI